MSMDIEKLSPSEQLDSFVGIVRPLRDNHQVFETIFNNLQADVQVNDPDENFVKDTEEKLVAFLKTLRASAGNVLRYI